MNNNSKCTNQKLSDCSSDNKYIKSNSSPIIKCGLPTTPIVFPDGTALDANALVASLSLDNTSLCNTSNLIEFEAQIITAIGFTAGSITLQLFKTSQCSANSTTITPTALTPLLTYTPTGEGTDIVKFFACDQGDCSNYYVVATVVTEIAGGSLTILNSRLNITATANNNCCCSC